VVEVRRRSRFGPVTVAARARTLAADGPSALAGARSAVAGAPSVAAGASSATAGASCATAGVPSALTDGPSVATDGAFPTVNAGHRIADARPGGGRAYDARMKRRRWRRVAMWAGLAACGVCVVLGGLFPVLFRKY